MSTEVSANPGSAGQDEFLGFLSEVESYLEEEMINVRQQKHQIESEATKLTKERNLDEALNEFEDFVATATQSLDTIKIDSEDIKDSVNKICDLSERTLKSFEVLKYRKSNVETILNRLTAVIEMNKLLPAFEKAVADKNLEECKRCIKTYKGIEDCISTYTMPNEIKQFRELSDSLVEQLKIDFESAIEKNQNDRLNQISNIFLMLHVEEHTLDKVLKVYIRKMDGDITSILETFTTHLKDAATVEKADYAFYNTFLDYLKALADIIDSAKEPIYGQFKLDGLFKLMSMLANLRADEIFEKRFLSHFYSHYETKSQPVNKLCESANQPNFMDLDAWVRDDTNSVSKYRATIHRIELMCEEITDISYQTELFRKHLYDIMHEKISSLSDKSSKEKDELSREYVRNIQSFKLFRYNMELLGSFNYYHQVFLRFQVVSMLQNAGVIRALMHWSKEFFTPFLSQGEGLSDATTLFEYLDEIFYLIRSCGIRSLSTLNKSIACGFLNHLQSTTLLEDLYSVTTGLLDRFLKKEFFNSSMMCFTSSFNLYNMIVIILLNNTDRVLVYSRNLKDVLVEEQMNMAGHYIEPKDSEMVHSCLEEFEIEVHKKFTQLLENRMAFLTDNLKSTIRGEIEKIKDINFQFSESLMAEYEGKIQYSGGLKSKLNACLTQWQQQFTKPVYEQFVVHLSQSIAKTLEGIVVQKRFHQLGAILLDKEIRAVISYLGSLADVNVKKSFAKLSYICEMLLLEDQKEMTEFYHANAGEITMEDFKRILRMRSDVQ